MMLRSRWCWAGTFLFILESFVAQNRFKDENDSKHIRRLLGEILTTYIPTILLIIISYFSNFFKPFFFEAIVVVNLTVMLVLVTMFISVSESLPKTSYIKMIDVWLVFVLLIPFFEVSLCFVMYHFFWLYFCFMLFLRGSPPHNNRHAAPDLWSRRKR